MVWVIDKSHTEVAFAVQHLMVSTVRGHFRDFDADIELDTEHPERSRVMATIAAASLTTGNDERDAHLRSSDFLDVERFPDITFASTHAAQLGPGSLWLRGGLTIHGITQEVTLRGRFHGPIADLREQPVIGFSLTLEFQRGDFGITWNLPLDGGGLFVGKTVTVTINAEVIERPAGDASASAASRAVASRANE